MLGWLEQGVCGRDEGERGVGRYVRRGVFCGLSDSKAQQEGLCSTLTRGWPVDRRMGMETEMEMEMEME